MKDLKFYQEIFFNTFNKLSFIGEPIKLYDPIDYALSAGGKRIRPVLTIMICDFFGNNYQDALNPAIAIEIFHNFTLVHDDIMDNAPIRRGQSTVYKKYGSNTAILSGDTMFAKAYEYVTRTREEKLPIVLKVFTQTAREVCEGQQYDMNFEIQNDVSIDEYMNMIRLKTAVLIGGSMKIGAIMGNADELQSQLMYNFGVDLGMVFQLQDDMLDTFGNEKTFGKRVGGDILDCKKTYLYSKAMENLPNDRKKVLFELYNNNSLSAETKIANVKELFIESGVVNDCKLMMNFYHNRSLDSLNRIDLEDPKKEVLRDFAESLLIRDF